MRGEHLISLIALMRDWGSSPHARGAPVALHAALRHAGIIPACAGSTCRLPRTSRSGRDHPRMRGEHNDELVRTVLVPGSSPHARGAPRGGDTREAVSGIIPACAGSTSTNGTTTVRTRDHPRMRGEHLSTPMMVWSARGSSPHARGAHLNTCGFAQDSSESH